MADWALGLGPIFTIMLKENKLNLEDASLTQKLQFRDVTAQQHGNNPFQGHWSHAKERTPQCCSRKGQAVCRAEGAVPWPCSHEAGPLARDLCQAKCIVPG